MGEDQAASFDRLVAGKQVFEHSLVAGLPSFWLDLANPRPPVEAYFSLSPWP
jgi:hypothetical protein